MRINKSEIQKRIDQKLISVQKHPEADLYIYNYTQECQFTQAWDEYTMMCRGLITDLDGNVVARPFKKFFNLEEEKTDLPALPFEVYEKFDGSLGILYWVGDEAFLATRGSFTSEQAAKGTELLRVLEKKIGHIRGHIDRDYTFLFEIIYPGNRIVCDYGEEEKLVLLAIVHTESGKEISIGSGVVNLPVETARRYDGITDYKSLKDLEEPNREGFVIRFEDGTRVKVKFDEYVRLHKLVTGLSVKSIWEVMQSGQNLKDLLEKVPDEFFRWAQDVWNQLLNDYEKIEHIATIDFAEIKHLTDRKEFALQAMKKPYPALLFNMFDGKDYSSLIYKHIKPKGNLTFKVDEA